MMIKPFPSYRYLILIFVLSSNILNILSFNAYAHYDRAHNQDIQISNAWVRNPPPNAPTTALFMTIHNKGTNVNLVEVKSDDFERIELHKTEMKNDLMSMVRQKDIPLPENQTIIFKPGGLHIMLFSPKKELQANEKLTFKMLFSDGSSRIIEALIKSNKHKKKPSHSHKH